MHTVPAEIVQRQLAHFHRADPAQGDGVREALARLGVATPARHMRACVVATRPSLR